MYFYRLSLVTLLMSFFVTSANAQTIALQCKNVDNPKHDMPVFIDINKRIMRLTKPETNNVSVTDSSVTGVFSDGFITVTVNRYTLRAVVLMKTDQRSETLEYDCVKLEAKKF